MKTAIFESKVSEALACLIEYGEEEGIYVTEEEVEAWENFQKEMENAAKNYAPNYSHGHWEMVTDTEYSESYYGFSRCDVLNVMSTCNKLVFTAFYREDYSQIINGLDKEIKNLDETATFSKRRSEL